MLHTRAEAAVCLSNAALEVRIAHPAIVHGVMLPAVTVARAQSAATEFAHEAPPHAPTAFIAVLKAEKTSASPERLGR